MSDRTVMLLVEDNEDDVFAFERALKKAGVTNELRIVTDGQQALDYLFGQGASGNGAQNSRPFLVFLDLKLPYFSGFEILQRMRHSRDLADVAVVVLTSSAEIKDKQQAYALGARSYLVKPPDAQDLLDVIASLETFWLQRRSTGPVTRKLE